jgi:hypothetical protein
MNFVLPTFLTRIASFQDPYLISGWFMGSHRAREGNAGGPPSLICEGTPLGVPRGEIPAPMEDGAASHWKYVVDKVIVYRGVYRADFFPPGPNRTLLLITAPLGVEDIIKRLRASPPPSSPQSPRPKGPSSSAA